MKKILVFFASFLSVVGGLGAFGFLIWLREYVIAAGVLIVCFAAYPTIKGWIKALINE